MRLLVVLMLFSTSAFCDDIKVLSGGAARGFVEPLAKTLPAESICVNPLKIPDPGVAADVLSRVLDLDRATLYNRIVGAKNRKTGFLWVKRKVSAEEAALSRRNHRSFEAKPGKLALRPLGLGRTNTRAPWIRSGFTPGPDLPRRCLPKKRA
jgi:hypothetical protein